MAVPVASLPDTGDTPFVNSIRAHVPLNKGVGISLPVNGRIVLEGDSIATVSAYPEPVLDMVLRTGGRLYLPTGYGKAVGGSKTTDVISRIASVTALSPKVVKLNVGTNDLSLTSDTPTVIFGRLRQIVDAYRTAGARTMMHLVLPRNDAAWNALSADRRADRGILNGLIASQTDVLVADAATGFDPATDTTDGIHPNWSGAQKIAAAEAAVLNPALGATNLVPMYADPSNLATGFNPGMAGTAGAASTGVTGQVATGWTAAMGGGMTGVASKVVIASGPAAGLDAQQIVVSGTNSANGNVANFSRVVLYSGVAGEEYEPWIYFELDAGHQNVRGPLLIGDTASPITPLQTLDGVATLAGLVRSPIGTPLAGSDTSNSIQARVLFSAGTVAATFRWAALFVRKVPAGQ